MRRISFLFLILIVAIFIQTAACAQFTLNVTPKVIGANEVEVYITSTIPGTIDVAVTLGLADQKPKDIFIGTWKKFTIEGGKGTTTIGQSDLPEGEYEVEVTFYPTWGPKDKVAKAAGIKSEISTIEYVNLGGTGESPEVVQRRNVDQMWVMENVSMGMPWDLPFWEKRFGSFELLQFTGGNPRIIKAYYFKSIDMTIYVNIFKDRIATWRNGRDTEFIR